MLIISQRWLSGIWRLQCPEPPTLHTYCRPRKLAMTHRISTGEAKPNWCTSSHSCGHPPPPHHHLRHHHHHHDCYHIINTNHCAAPWSSWSSSRNLTECLFAFPFHRHSSSSPSSLSHGLVMFHDSYPVTLRQVDGLTILKMRVAWCRVAVSSRTSEGIITSSRVFLAPFRSGTAELDWSGAQPPAATPRKGRLGKV